MPDLALFAGEKLENLTGRQLDYRRFLASDQWKLLRKECYRLAGYKCSRCHCENKVLNAHHKVYPDRFEDTKQDQLECLCRDCHRELHGLKSDSKNRQFSVWEDVVLARSQHKISRGEFDFWKRKLNPPKKHWTIRRKKKKRRKRVKNQWQGSGLEFTARRKFQLTPVKHWNNRGSTSN